MEKNVEMSTLDDMKVLLAEISKRKEVLVSQLKYEQAISYREAEVNLERSIQALETISVE